MAPARREGIVRGLSVVATVLLAFCAPAEAKELRLEMFEGRCELQLAGRSVSCDRVSYLYDTARDRKAFIVTWGTDALRFEGTREEQTADGLYFLLVDKITYSREDDVDYVPKDASGRCDGVLAPDGKRIHIMRCEGETDDGAYLLTFDGDSI